MSAAPATATNSHSAPASEESTSVAGPPTTPAPHPKLRDLDALEGTWHLEGSDAGSGHAFTGTVTRRWLPGGHFMVQTTHSNGRPADGIEYIGYDCAADSLRSMLFSSEGPGPFCPFALEYWWSINGDELTIWHGFHNSPAKFVGIIDRDARTIRGAWQWPGGGYDVTATRTD